MKTAPWRLIDTGPLSGVENMAIDEALLDCFEPGCSQGVLRLYGWDPPAFSCGRFQQPAGIIDLGRCRRDGIQVVQRISGGGVIYHAGELTYSLVCAAEFLPDARAVKDAFTRLTGFLLAFYRGLGLPVCYASEYFGSTRRLGERTPLCFSGMERCDILVHGKKIGGNAQRRLKNVIFQHGSIPLHQAAGTGNDYLLVPDRNITAWTTTLADQGVSPDRQRIGGRLTASFEEYFAVRLRPSSLTDAEKSRSRHICEKRNDFSAAMS